MTGSRQVRANALPANLRRELRAGIPVSRVPDSLAGLPPRCGSVNPGKSEPTNSRKTSSGLRRAGDGRNQGRYLIRQWRGGGEAVVDFGVRNGGRVAGSHAVGERAELRELG